MKIRSLCVVVAAVGAFLVPATPARATATRVAAWLPYWDHARGVQSFQQNASQYSELSPFWYALSASGSIAAYPNAGAASVIDAARAAGVPLIPTISNEFDAARVTAMLSDSTRRSAHVADLASLVRSNGFAGIDIDYESLAASDRDAFSAFARELASALRGFGARLSVTVHPKTSEPGTWSGPQAHDYAALGQAADRIRLMAYDYHWSGSSAGPVAPAGWVDSVARFAASVITPSKIQLGLPLYGYDWVGTNGTSVTHDQVGSLISKYGATVQWSDTDKESWFTYRDAAGASHTVWFSDERSTAAKLASVSRYGLAGAVFWRLGGEDAGVWRATAGTATATPTTTVDTAIPSVRIISPRSNARVAVPSQRVDFTASDNVGVVRTEIYVDGAIVYADTTGRRSFTLTTSGWSGGRHRIAVRALDAAGNAAVVTIYVRR